MEDKKQEAKPSGPMRTRDLQNSMLSTSGQNKLFGLGIRGKEAKELAKGLGKYGSNLDPDDVREIEKELKKAKETGDNREKIRAKGLEQFFRDRGMSGH